MTGFRMTESQYAAHMAKMIAQKGSKTLEPQNLERYATSTRVKLEEFTSNPRAYIRPKALVTFSGDEPTYLNEAGMTWHVIKKLRTRGCWVAHMDAATKAGVNKKNSAGRVPGFPDLLVIRDGRMVLIELKLPSGHFTEAQLIEIPKLLNAGATIHVCLSEHEVLSAVFGGES